MKARSNRPAPVVLSKTQMRVDAMPPEPAPAAPTPAPEKKPVAEAAPSQDETTPQAKDTTPPTTPARPRPKGVKPRAGVVRYDSNRELRWYDWLTGRRVRIEVATGHEFEGEFLWRDTYNVCVRLADGRPRLVLKANMTWIEPTELADRALPCDACEDMDAGNWAGPEEQPHTCRPLSPAPSAA